MLTAIITGLGLGLSTGLLCAASCLPVMLPYMLASGGGRVAADGDRGLRGSALAMGEFVLGRLAAYLLLGLLAGSAGISVVHHPLAVRLLGLAMLALGLLMVVNGLGRSFPESRRCASLCAGRVGRRVPIAAGFVMGLSPCVPLLTALADAARRGPLGGMALMAAFFVTSSWALLPLLGAHLPARRERLRGMAEVALLLVGLAYALQGLLLLVR